MPGNSPRALTLYNNKMLRGASPLLVREGTEGCVRVEMRGNTCHTELRSKSDYGRTDILVRSFKGQTRMSDLPPIYRIITG